MILTVNRLCISFSGGRTSAYMTDILLRDSFVKSHYKDVVVLFANTGQEYEETLEFVNDCDKHLGFNTVWLEADVVHEPNKGTKHKIVDFKSASRKGEPFEQVCKKYGIPNTTSPICTRELKLSPITSYLRQIGWKKNTYDVAIGIRFDEMDRVTKDVIKKGIWYPLVDGKVTKSDVLKHWSKQHFNLQLPEHKGNCKWCWKKSDRKLFTLIHEDISTFEFPHQMEEKYKYNDRYESKEARYFFRNNRSTQQMIFEARTKEFKPFTDDYFVNISNFDESLDSFGGCSESCEVY